MTQILYRTAELTPGDGRTVYGLAVPFGQVATVSDAGGRPYREMFERGSFRRTIAERGNKVRLLIGHDHRRLPIGKATALEERADGLYCEFYVSRTSAGDDALIAVRDGLAGGFSVGFAGIREHWDGDVLVRTEVALREVSVTEFPAYSGAAISGVRHNSTTISRQFAELWLLAHQ
ncbi:hypothetical protein A5649_09790 [Mycolicibacter heraklionensis]|uniref:Prohead serine protease domain-containing protein n=1 Tax=Mycolicibacter heraklionensis TaxID=512402 RepID=A0AA91EYN1_9MYCO|nr:HK97 family phage prohead protease [Mycolicibacter heraklionensis]OBK82137.1 hypothetical protein A5649_09790 [Mycolicibacter heraklionensis]